ncbi:MAG: polyprenyl synthetase family protein [Firmicutes bacterium]|nr:polyprenyl synthetase family protein [Bacillota bacterium]
MQVVEQLLGSIKPYLDDVERRLRTALDDSGPETRDIALHLVEGGGKRIRPIMTLLSARVFGAEISRAVPVAVAAELIHMATLVHDDVIDEASTRRGRPTANTRWGNHSSVLAGDCLLARALVLLVDDGTPEIVRIMSDMILRMCDGEIQQKASLGRLDQTEEEYFRRIEKKTALFFAACCRSGALIQGAPARHAQALAEYGRNIGMAFQVVDDLLDVSGQAEVVGKPVANDLAAGVLTLPVLYVLRDETVRKRIAGMLNGGTFTREAIEEILGLVRRDGAIEYSRNVAVEFARRAQEELLALPPGDGRDLLATVADELLERAY